MNKYIRGSAEPMPKVMHIGYFFDPEKAGRGGVIVYQWSLMRSLRDLGWDTSLFAGTRHTFSGKLRTRLVSSQGLPLRELIDSPLRHCDFGCDPLAHTSNDRVDAITEKIIDSERPDIVHLHDPRLHPASIVKVIRKKGIPVLKTIHNYFDLCPQGELMYRGRSMCGDYCQGARCRECLPSLGGQSFLKEKMIGTFSGTPVYPVLRGLWRGVQSLKGSGNGVKIPAQTPFSADVYVQRRERLIEALNSLDAIHCSSHYVAGLLRKNGAQESNLKVITIASGSTDSINPAGPRDSTGPVVFVYLTGESYNKGYETLLEAFSMLDQKKARLKLFGFRDPGGAAARYRGLNVRFHGPYAPQDLNRILSGCDVGMVPSLWQEIFGLVGLEFQAARLPVIASHVGGIEEWLQDGKNGFLVNPGDAADLAAKMGFFLNTPRLLEKMREGITPPKSMKDHAREMASLYDGLIKR